MRGYQFLRQKPLNRYIADFYCQKLNLVIEVDGFSHYSSDAQKNDIKRDTILKRYGLFILRIDDLEVKGQINNVLGKIEAYIDDFENANPPSPFGKMD